MIFIIGQIKKEKYWSHSTLYTRKNKDPKNVAKINILLTNTERINNDKNLFFNIKKRTSDIKNDAPIKYIIITPSVGHIAHILFQLRNITKKPFAKSRRVFPHIILLHLVYQNEK